MSAGGTCSRISRLEVKLALAVALAGALPSLAAGEKGQAIPKRFHVEPATLICLGFEWDIEGDSNRNATVKVQYRRKGEREWRDGLPLLRIGGDRPGLWPDPEQVPEMFAGSILDLTPDTEYECRFEMSDPDGVKGSAVQQVVVRTRREPRAAAGGRTRHVYPKDWSGPKQEPAYDGLIHAYYGYKQFADWIFTTDPVVAGDVIEVHAGTYRADRYDYRDYHGIAFHGTYSLTQKGTEERPIVIRAAGDGQVVFDGNGAYRLFDVSVADYNYFEGLTIRNAEIAFYAGEKDIVGSTGVVVRRCRIEDVGIGFMGQNANSRFFYIADNVFLGRMPRDRMRFNGFALNTEGKRYHKIESYFAVKVYGQGHTICHNYAGYFYDGFDVCTHGPAERERERKAVAIDIYNNDVYLANDNFIEADGGVHNIRILRNRGFNCPQIGYSFQPVLGGPAYLIRNIGYHLVGKPAIKYGKPSGVLIYHNTFTAVAGIADNTQIMNNLFLGPAESSLPVIAFRTSSERSMIDYNGHRLSKTKTAPFVFRAPLTCSGREGANGTQVREFGTWDEFRAATCLERHGVLVDYRVLENVPEPSLEILAGPEGNYYPLARPDGLDFRPSAGGKAIDAGIRLPNVNDDFEGAGPDLGAIERGKPLPVYGPREQK